MLLLVQVAGLLSLSYSCSPGGNIENGNEIITDPTLSFQASPPVSWTYYPVISGPIPGAPPVASFFPGQSMTATEAMNRVTGDVTAAVLDAFSSAGLSAPGLQVNIVYEADQISNCYMTPPTPPGTRIGLLSGGAITETATVTGNAGAPVALTSCPPRGIAGVGEFQEYIKDIEEGKYNLDPSLFHTGMMDFLASALEQLEKGALEEFKEAVIGSDRATINVVFMELFAAIVTKYDDLVEEEQNVQPLLDALMHLNRSAHVKPKEIYIALMDVYDSVRTPSAVQLVIEMLLDWIPELNNGSSRCTNVALLESFMCDVVSCLPQTSTGLSALIDSCFSSYVNLGHNPASSTLLIASSQHSGRPAIPVVYSADYRFQLCLPALTSSLNVRFSNSHNVSLVLHVLQGFIPAIPECSLSRHTMPLFMEFLCALLYACGQVNLVDIHDECLQAFINSLQRFEPTAQLLILRRLIHLIQTEQLKISLESQVMGWMVDLYRYRLQKYPIFKAELGFVWAELAEIRYKELHESVHFYTAILVLAQFQALHRINRELLREVDARLLDPLQKQLAHWTTLITVDGENNDRLQSLPFLQFTMLQTRNYVKQFLDEVQ